MTSSSKLVVVTGASSGIGQALARELHARGHSLLLVARRRERLEALKTEFNSVRNNSAEYRVCDLASRSDAQSLAAELAAMNVYGLVNNAGIGSLGAFHTLDLTAELSQIELNVIAPLQLTHAVVPQMISRKSGFIINVSSIMAYQAVPYVATYAASKAFEWRHSLAVERELSSFGIKVLTLCPGPTDTEFFGVARLPGGMSGFSRGPASAVAQKCLRDLDAGRKISIPGCTARLLVLLAMLLPTSVYTWLVRKRLQSRLPSMKTG